ncbi:MAG: cation acetate symporter [Crenarchaeota archaeon]|nr:cation acetate symporter [Thermoproteota archaeon]
MFSVVALIMIIIVALVTMGIAWWSYKRVRSIQDFYAAGRSVPWILIAWALTSNYLSAASFLGVAGGISNFGLDRVWDPIGYFAGWVLVLIVAAEYVRKVGKFTVADILNERFKGAQELRALAMIATVIISTFYMIPQMIGAGSLMSLLLNWPYPVAVVVIGALVVLVVMLGGIRSTVYSQVFQALVLWTAMLLIFIAYLIAFGGPGAILDKAYEVPPPALATKYVNEQLAKQYMPDINTINFHMALQKSLELAKITLEKDPELIRLVQPGAFARDVWNQLSLALGIILGTMGLPHILIYFYTVPKPEDARKGTIGAIFNIGGFYLFSIFVGFAAGTALFSLIVGWLATGYTPWAKNMPVVMSGKMLGGELLMGLAAAGAFAAILSTVGGLMVAATNSVAHDLYANIIRKGKASEEEQLLVARIVAAIVGTIAIIGGLLLKGFDVSYLVVLAFGIAASSFATTLIMNLWWKRFTRAGAIASMLVGLVVAVLFVLLRLGGVKALGPIPVLVQPALYSVPASFAAGIIVSYLTKDTGEEGFLESIHA